MLATTIQHVMRQRTLKAMLLGMRPVHYWPLLPETVNGSQAMDVVAATTATLIGSPSPVVGPAGTGLSLGASGQYIRLTENANLPNLRTNGQNFSLVIFVRIDSASTADVLIGRDWSSSGAGWSGVLLLGATGSLVARVSTGAAAADTGSAIYPTATWTCVGMSHDHANLRLYIDGVQVASVATALAVDFASTGRSWVINRRFENLNGSLSGAAAHAAAFDRALSASDFLAISLAGRNGAR